MTVYLIRHGQSVDDEKGLGQSTNSPLSLAGQQEIRRLKIEIYDQIRLDLVYHSPQTRAKQTAQILFPQHKLKELSFTYEYQKPSRFHGLDRKAKEKYWQENKENKYDPDWKPEDGESFNDILKRVKQLTKLLLENHQSQVVGMVGHGVFFKHFIGYWKMKEKYTPQVFFDQLQPLKIPNGACIESLERFHQKHRLT